MMRMTTSRSVGKIRAVSSPTPIRSPSSLRGSFVNSPRACALRPFLHARRNPPFPVLRSALRRSAADAPLASARRLSSLSSGTSSSTGEICKGGRADPMAWGRRGSGGALVALMVVMCSLSSSPVSSSAEAEFVKKTVSAHDIVIFSKSYCPYCKRAKTVFKELDKVPYVVELDQREDGGDIQDALSEIVGRRTVPQVFINGKHIGGSDDTVEAYQSGALAKLLGIESKDDL